uniref:PRC-barrel domain protein n=1 Tax=Psychrobacter sp. (strain PRwf-1) TaxID=349106 RepID=A5WH11_PSYWF
MSQLIRLKDIQSTHRDIIGDDYYDPTGKAAYGAGEEKIGKIEGALVEDITGRIRYLIVDVGGWFNSKEVLVPAGLARIVGDDVFFDSLTKSQVEAMEEYDHDYQYSYKEQANKDRAAFVADTVPAAERVDIKEDYYNAPNTLELLEERLTVNKDRIVAGLVKVGKHVVTENRAVDVELEEEHAHIERTEVNRPTTRRIGDDAGADSVEVELEAERANVNKETYVTEEVNVGKTTERHTETINETIQREELDIDRDGNIVDREGNIVERDDLTADDVRAARGK